MLFDLTHKVIGAYDSFKLSWLMIWFVIQNTGAYIATGLLFQTKLTYDMICYHHDREKYFPCGHVSN